MKNKNRNKFVSLNFNLKNEILIFLPFEFFLEEISKISKSFKYALDNSGLMKILNKNFQGYINQIEINSQSINKIKSEFENLNLTDGKLNEICAFLLLHKTLLFGNCLKLSQNKGFAIEILLLIIQHKKLKILDFSISNIGENGENGENLCLFFHTLLKNKSIKQLSLTRNHIGKASGSFKKFCFEFFAFNCTLEYLDLGVNNIGIDESNMQVFCEALALNKSILQLDISFNYLAAKNRNNLKLFSDFFLKLNNQMQILILDNNSIGSFESDMQYLAEGLKINKALKKINLKFNKIGQNPKDAFYLCEVINNNKSLNSIDLSNNFVGGIEDDIENLCKALLANEALSSINLENNAIDNDNEFLEELATVKKQIDVIWKNELFPYSFKLTY